MLKILMPLSVFVALFAACGGAFLNASPPRSQQQRDQPESTPAAVSTDQPVSTAEAGLTPVERARRETKMLDDIYKTSIVLITTHYVQDDDDLPAGAAFRALFEAVEKKGWHSVRLIDVSGQPYNEENAARDEFEQSAVRELARGRASFEQLTERDGKQVLRTATAVPVVMEKCVMCHDNYKDVQKGVAVGALSYEVPVLP